MQTARPAMKSLQLRQPDLSDQLSSKSIHPLNLSSHTQPTLVTCDDESEILQQKLFPLPPVISLSSLRPLPVQPNYSSKSRLGPSTPSPPAVREPQDDTELLRSRIQAVFLTYRSPNTTPKQYVSHAQLLESFKDLADTVSGPNAFSVASTSCSCQMKPCPASGAQGRCSECEGVHGVVEMRSKRGSRPPEKVRCSIQSSSGKMILSIFGGSDYGTEVGFIRLEESYVATYGEKPLTFAVGLRSRRECFEESEIHFSCHTSVSRDKWVGALIQGGSKSRRKLEDRYVKNEMS
ncbi:hypothetical protein GUITHDRAFT_145190 [Guillardia theta CCMP2712]|uniref:PH domain-containing protein n=1 Tax=Guillardia theta (strain CCMP2712) TaxID=905079 RepID=L1IMA8_GUITC|nr:hypothetical protein GUITHDRAFT_145190 [Guillardia theta CCMP2712]EKX37237.1 hypothetical protein GUITHDRAFT_145190 [Guillardia theta CCMP2712]|eukprot:XP_005824217.1 hypothetical protein GUITHDRAFT_145190 [Guillardia theta CCMP2712]